MKNSYVSLVRRIKPWASRAGVLSFLERRESRAAAWARSLFSIYDSHDLIALDLPWWTFSSIDFVDHILSERPGTARVLEYGSGASTVWLAKRSKSVISIEHDAAFAEQMLGTFREYDAIQLNIVPARHADATTKSRSKRKGHTHLSFDLYVNSVEKSHDDFDLIVIDGRARVSCLEKAIPRLASNGAILFDNSDRQEYRQAIENCGLIERKFAGLAPALPIFSQTSILTRPV